MWNFKQFQEIYFCYESSDINMHDFCINEIINKAKFYYWQTDSIYLSAKEAVLNIDFETVVQCFIPF